MEPIQSPDPEVKPDDNNENLNDKMHKKYAIIPYLRELSIVIIGVFITLLLTSMINNYTRQKEVKGMLKLIKEELYNNIEEIDWIQENWNTEQQAFEILKPNLGDLSVIPVDTLEKYRNSIGILHSFDIKNDSYETLKSSFLIQYVKEKELLSKFSKNYRRLNNLSEQLERYSRQKQNFLMPVLENMTETERDLWLNSNIYNYYYYSLREKGSRSFLFTGGTILSPGIFDSVKNDITKLIHEMEKYGY